MTIASASSAASTISGSLAMSPSMLNTPSVMTSTVRVRAAVGVAHVAQCVPKRIDVGVRKDPALGLGEPDAVDDAGVVERVADDDGALRRQDGDDARVRGEAGLEGQDGLGVLEVGQARLQLLVQGHRAGNGPHGP